MKKFTISLCILQLAFCISGIQAQSQLWGVTSMGGDGFGTIFKTDGNGNNYQVKETFDPNIQGHSPYTKLCLMPNGKLLGTTFSDGLNNGGVIYEYDPATNTYVKKVDFGTTNGTGSTWWLLKATNGKLYSATSYGGANNKGVLFEYDYATNTYTKKMDFNGTNGHPLFGLGGLIEATNGKLYGMTSRGGVNDEGVIFEYDYNTNTYIKKIDLDSATGRTPLGALTQAANGKLYGMTRDGGANDNGVIFEYDYTTNTYTKKFDLSFANGRFPAGNLLEATNGKLYGMTGSGGANNDGVIFEYDYLTNTFTKKMDFNHLTTGWVGGSFLKAADGMLYGTTRFGGTTGTSGVLFQYDYTTNTYTKKIDFNGSGGEEPLATLVQGPNGKLYGTGSTGGLGGETHSSGVIYEYDYTTNTYSKKIDFNFAINGSYPSGSLTKASNGKFYGMANGGGGAFGFGTIFEYDYTTGTLTKKVDFDNITKGYYPRGSMIEAANGKLYGMAQGGANNVGLLFEYNYATNTYTKKVDLVNANGNDPTGSLAEAANGKLYGMTILGGATNDGVIFEYNYTTNTYTKKLDLNSNGTGSRPVGALVQASNGKLYGMTGVGDFGVSPGWIFEYDYSANAYTKKIDFTDPNGRDPEGSLMVATNGKLYGMTTNGGANNKGVIFEYDPSTNTYTKKFDFGGTNGEWPTGTLMQSSNGKLYGMTSQGGAYNRGVFFEYDYGTNTFTKKLDFNGTNGSSPAGAQLVETGATVNRVAETSKEISWSMYPNPTNNVFTIRCSSVKGTLGVTIMNELGTIIYTETKNEISGGYINMIDLSKQSKGIYFMELTSGDERSVQKIILQ